MRKYRPIAVYDKAEDIIDLFPCDAIKPDMGDIIYNHYMAGHGSPRQHNCGDDPESWWTEKEVKSDKNFILTSDKRHGVRFTRGVKHHGMPIGYFIDIYGLAGEGEPAPKTPGKTYILTPEQQGVIAMALADRIMKLEEQACAIEHNAELKQDLLDEAKIVNKVRKEFLAM